MPRTLRASRARMSEPSAVRTAHPRGLAGLLTLGHGTRMSLPVTRQHLPRHPHDTQESGGSGLSLLPPEHVCPIGIALRRVQARLCSAVVGDVLRMRRRSDLTAARPDKMGFEYLGADHAHAEHARATDLDVTPTSEATSFARPRSGLVGRRAKQDHGARGRLDGLILSSSGCSGTAVLSRRGLVVAHGSELLSGLWPLSLRWCCASGF